MTKELTMMREKIQNASNVEDMLHKTQTQQLGLNTMKSKMQFNNPKIKPEIEHRSRKVVKRQDVNNLKKKRNQMGRVRRLRS